MKISKNLLVLAAFVCIGLFGGKVYASEVTYKDSNVKVETVVKDDKKVEVITTEDGYVRIAQPAKANTFTFESKMNVGGETKQGTDISIEVYNIKTDNVSSSTSKPTVYKLNTVGITGTFNQLIELLEGENKVVLIYTNEKDKKDKLEMIFYIIREKEETKERIKSMTVYNLDGTIKTNALK